ncbi:unnamed protein product [Parnassius mnemosyne]|uniref:FP protein C-terminal domain-containing protein n=1 Tax=Parnassius mnemosyne TaxID=213953 RepID=A0AAV1L432_9NEOP
MFLQRTPPNVFSSDGDIPASVKKISGESFITTRKRKQMENDKIDTNMIKFEEKFDNQMLIWNKTLAIASQIALLTYLLTYLSSRTIPDGCREAAKKNEYKYVWVKHGTVLARNTDTSPAIVIRSLQDIARIK